MPALKIPIEHRRRLAAVAVFDEKTFESLAGALQSASPALAPGQLARSIEGSVKEIDPGVLAGLVSTITSLYRTRASAEKEPPDFLSDLASVFESEPEFAGIDKSLLVHRTQQLLDMDASLGITSKAYDIATEHEHVFCDVRILTDIRPIFGSSVEDQPKDAVLVHMLKIGYHESGVGDHRDFYIALDTFDLYALSEAVQRAESKEQALLRMAGKADLRLLGFDDQNDDA